jgi:polyvinyl alcohol dehydrogenase (cytochrome)
VIESANWRRAARESPNAMKLAVRIATGFAALLICCGPLWAQDGAALYAKHCAPCHDQVSPRVPPRSALQEMSARRILRTLDFGLMMSIAYPLRRDEREAIANFLGMGAEEPKFPPAAYCSKKEPSFSGRAAGNWPGWSPTFSNTRFQTTTAAYLTAAEVSKLKFKWAFGFPGDDVAFGAPTIQGDALFTGSASGTVHAINAKMGCIYWTFQANGPVRAAPLVVQNSSAYSVFFGDQIGWFYALDAKTGKPIWQRRVEDHEATRLTGAAAFDAGVLFVPAASWEEARSVSPDYSCCTFRGSITAIRAADGSPVWKTYLVDSPQKTGVTAQGKPIFGPSGVPVWSAPTVDTRRGLLYIATGDNYSEPATAASDAVIALQIKTGKIVWSKQTTSGDIFNGGCSVNGPNCPANPGPDVDYGSSVMLVRISGRDLLIAGQKSGVVYAFDPDQNGKILWQARVGKGGSGGGVQWGMTSDGKNVYAAVSDAVRLPGKGGSVATGGEAAFDPVEGGGLTALHLADGSKAWFAPSYPCAPPRPGCSPAQSGALSSIPGIVFSGSLDAHLRAFSTEDGHLLWDFDTARDYSTVNGLSARGGSLDGAGPVIVDGMLYVNSGYPRFRGMPGNVLLAFSVDGK